MWPELQTHHIRKLVSVRQGSTSFVYVNLQYAILLCQLLNSTHTHNQPLHPSNQDNDNSNNYEPGHMVPGTKNRNGKTNKTNGFHTLCHRHANILSKGRMFYIS